MMVRMMPLGEIAEVCAGGGAPQSPDAFGNDGFPFIRAGSLPKLLAGAAEASLEKLTTRSAKANGLRLFPAETVLFAKSGMSATKGHIYKLREPAYVVNHLAALIPRDPQGGPFLVRLLQWCSPTQLIRDSSYPSIRLGDIELLEVPVPSERGDRMRIGEILDRAEALRAKRRAALAQLDTLTQSIFLEMFGDPSKNPQRWPLKAVGEIAEVKGGKRLPKGEEYSLARTPFRYIRVTDLRGGSVDEGAVVYLKPEVQAKIARYIVNTGDVIISIAGSIGLIAPVPSSLDGANLTENAAKLVQREEGGYDSRYLAAVLQMPAIQSQIASHIGQVTIGKLALFRIEKLTVPLPPVALQEEFVRRLAQVAALKSGSLGSLAGFDALFASLQHRAFRGEL